MGFASLIRPGVCPTGGDGYRWPGEEVLMRSRWLLVLVALSMLLAGAFSGTALGSANVLVTRDGTASSYLRYAVSTDATTSACSTGRRSQNEPTVAVNPHNTQVAVAGANDYCAQIVNGDVWAGYYRSTNGGASWKDSLVPGYPADASAARPATRPRPSTGMAACSTRSSASTAPSPSTAACSWRATPTTARPTTEPSWSSAEPPPGSSSRVCSRTRST